MSATRDTGNVARKDDGSARRGQGVAIDVEQLVVRMAAENP
jgi:hypothetical protein